jgi:short-subunit dehydrogenase
VALPLLRESDDPYLAAVSSASAYLGLPRAEAYGASKVAVKYLMESLMVDLDPDRFTVSVICPGFVKTPLTEQNDFPMPFMIESDRAAETIADRMESRTAEIHFPRIFTWGIKLLSILPGFLRRFIIRRWVSRS